MASTESCRFLLIAEGGCSHVTCFDPQTVSGSGTCPLQSEDLGTSHYYLYLLQDKAGASMATPSQDEGCGAEVTEES